VTGFVLLDVFGLRAMAIILSLMGAFLGAFLVLKYGQSASRRAVLALSAVTLFFVLFQGPLTRHVMEAMLYKNTAPGSSSFVKVAENRYGIVTVSEDGLVYGGGIYDGRFNIDPMNDSNGIVRALSLSLFHPAPRDVFMIGLASGSWAQLVAANPDVRELTIVEINPAYIDLVRQNREVRSVLANPKVHIIIDDAARWLRRNPDARFDAIVANATYHFRSNASNLLSVEFNGLVSSHLKKGGVYLYNTTNSVRVQRTGCDSFRYGFRFTNNMLVSNDPIHVDAARWRRNLLATAADGHPLFNLNHEPDSRTMAQYMAMAASASHVTAQPAFQPVETCASLLGRTSGLAVVTDDNMGTEWRYPLGLN
jgi:spermidine synthase